MTLPTASALRLAVLVSGRGSNMLAIAHACATGAIGAEVTTVISDTPGAAGIGAARDLGLHAQSIGAGAWRKHGRFDRAGFEAALREAVDGAGAGLVVLAGFMRVLSAGFVAHYEGRMLNIHPSLLPLYPGLDTHARVLAAGDAEHGASVHYVTPALDAGPVVLQGRVPVLATDDVHSLSARVHAVEHRIYPMVIGWVAEGRLEWNGGTPRLDGSVLEQPRQWMED